MNLLTRVGLNACNEVSFFSRHTLEKKVIYLKKSALSIDKFDSPETAYVVWSILLIVFMLLSWSLYLRFSSCYDAPGKTVTNCSRTVPLTGRSKTSGELCFCC